eukprot:6037657-Alexandrium_andersonii.AAC.1
MLLLMLESSPCPGPRRGQTRWSDLKTDLLPLLDVTRRPTHPWRPRARGEPCCPLHPALSHSQGCGLTQG